MTLTLTLTLPLTPALTLTLTLTRTRTPAPTLTLTLQACTSSRAVSCGSLSRPTRCGTSWSSWSGPPCLRRPHDHVHVHESGARVLEPRERRAQLYAPSHAAAARARHKTGDSGVESACGVCASQKSPIPAPAGPAPGAGGSPAPQTADARGTDGPSPPHTTEPARRRRRHRPEPGSQRGRAEPDGAEPQSAELSEARAL